MLGTTPWPKYQYNNKNTGLSPYKSNTDGTLKWFQETDGGVSSPPAIDTDGTIYVARWAAEWVSNVWTSVGYLYAYNLDGTLKWKYDIGYSDSSPAIGADGTIYIGAWNCYLYAINPDGTLKWKYLTQGHVALSSPAIASDGTVYIATTQNCANWQIGDGKLYAINPDGTLKWAFQTDVPALTPPIYPVTPRIWTSPAIGSDGTIYIGAGDAKLYAINPDGSLKWKYLMGYQVVWSSPSIGSDGTIYMGANDHKMHAVNPIDGTVKWIYDAGHSITTCAAIGQDGTIYFGNNRFIALNSDGTLKWEFVTSGDVYSSPVISADGTIYFGISTCIETCVGTVFALNSDGTLKWRYDTPSLPVGDWLNIDSAPSIGSDGTVYIGSYVYREDPESYYGAFYAFQSIIPSTKVVCTIKRDEGIYSKPKYCYIGEGIFTKK